MFGAGSENKPDPLIIPLIAPSKMSIGIISLSEENDDREHEYYVTDAASDNEYWQAFVKKCNALLKAAPAAHAELVRAARKYGTMDPKSKAERQAQADLVLAFMDDEFDVTELGTWTPITRTELNRRTMDGHIEQTFVFVHAIDLENY